MNEVRSAVGSGTMLQELYLTPSFLTQSQVRWLLQERQRVFFTFPLACRLNPPARMPAATVGEGCWMYVVFYTQRGFGCTLYVRLGVGLDVRWILGMLDCMCLDVRCMLGMLYYVVC